jgi:glyceraldehyde 3-phosphate dehydrogenase
MYSKLVIDKVKEINGLLKKAPQSYLKGIPGVANEEIVSTGYIRDNGSSIHDGKATLGNSMKDEKRFFKIVS